ncbi:hypothetical protein ABFV05_020449 [Capra hircus]
MNSGSFYETPREDRKKLEKKSKSFKNISKYFSKKEWARLGYSEKITYVNLKRNYETMTRLGLKCTLPAFMCPKNGATESKHCDSKIKNPREKDEPAEGTSNMQGRKRQKKVMSKKPVKGKKHSKIVPGTSGPEQAQRQLRSQTKASISAQQSKKTSGADKPRMEKSRTLIQISTMNRGSFYETPREDRKKLEKKSKSFKNISKYFSKKEWARLGYSEKVTYVNLKRNYETMTRLGLKCTPPAFMCPKNGATESKRCDSKIKNPREKDEPAEGTSNMQGRKRQKKVMPKKPVKGKKRSKIVPGTSGPEQAQRQLRSQTKASISAQQSKKTSGSKKKTVNVWANRLRKRKPVAYEEISDPEEED